MSDFEGADFSYIDRNFASVKEKMEKAMLESGRDDEVVFMAAVKSADVDEINYLHRALGVNHIGENRVQELTEKYPLKDDVSWHLIGHLQSNKVRKIITEVDLIQSVDSVKLAAEISKRSMNAGIVTDCLVEVNIGGEESKSGIVISP